MKDKRDRRLQEVEKTRTDTQSSTDCAFCTLLCQSGPEKASDDGPSMHFMTEREMEVLAAMRRLKEEASSIKRRMEKIEEGAGERSFQREHNKRTYHQIQGKLWQQGMSEDWLALSRRLADLREEWKKMNQERMDAAEERMRLLGHIQ